VKPLRRVLAVVPAACLGLSGAAVLASPAHAAATNIQITEIAYGGKVGSSATGGDGEYVELTNEGTVAQDLTGWTYDTGATTPAAGTGIPLSGTLAAGASLIVTDVTADEFRAEWGLKPSVQVVSNNKTHTLDGGPNGAYVFDASGSVADQVTYASGAFPNKKGEAKYPTTATSAPDLSSGWADETVDGAQGSWTSANGAVGSPGASTYGTSTPADVRDTPAAEDADKVVKIDAVDATAGTVTLDNTGSSSHDISRWTVQDTAGTAITIPDGTTLAAGQTETFTAVPDTFAASDFAKLFDGITLVDTSTWAAADPDWKNITINEVSSDNAAADQIAAGDPLPDAVELYNKGDDPVDLSGWKQIDSGDASAATAFGPIYVNGSTTPAADMTIPAHGYAVFQSVKGLGSGGDAVKLYAPDGSLIDSVTYGAGQAGVDESANTDGTYKSLAACPDGGDTYLMVKAYSFGSSNATPCSTGTPPATVATSDVPCTTEAPGPTTDPVTGALAWPGSPEVKVADDTCAWDGGGTQQDLSGLVFDPTDPDILWAVKNKSVVFKLTQNSDGVWQKVTTDGWADGKDITFPGGTGLPDSEGMTVGPDGALYITTERDNADNDVPHDSILRFDPTQSGTTLTATDEWNLTSDLFAADDSADANLGFEGVTYVPDSYLTANGFIDDNTSTFYKPSTYPDKATAGLFFAAVEKTGHLEAYALDKDHTFKRVADVATGMAGVMDVSYDAGLQRIWAQCDNTCGVTLTLLKIGSDGHFTPEKHYARPAGLPDNNLEGFAVAPVSTAVNGERKAVWSDDGNFGTSAAGVSTLADDGGHSLWSGLMDVDLKLGSQGYQAPTKPGGGSTSGGTRPGSTKPASTPSTTSSKVEHVQAAVHATHKAIAKVKTRLHEAHKAHEAHRVEKLSHKLKRLRHKLKHLKHELRKAKVAAAKDHRG